MNARSRQRCLEVNGPAPMVGIAGLLAMASLLLCASPSFAAKTHVFEENFGSASHPSFAEPEGLAVDRSTGDLLVIEKGSGAVSRYNPDGTPAEFTALGSNVIDGSETPEGSLSFPFGAEEVQVAVDNSGGATDGDIYVTQSSEQLIDIFDEDGSFLGQLTEYNEGPAAEGAAQPLGEACGVAVDPSGSVYVGAFSGQIHKYEPAADPVVNADNSSNFIFSEACTVAAGAGPTVGSIFAAPFLGSVSKLDSSSGLENYVVSPGGNTTETVNQATGLVYTAVGTEVREYDASGPLEGELLSSFSRPGKVTGIAVSTASGKIYVAREGGSGVEVWGPLVTLPDVITEGAGEVGATSATLGGTVNPQEVPLTECFFEYDTTEYKEEAPHGEVAPCNEPDAAEVGEGSAPVAVHAKASGLSSGTSYHFRLVAENADGSAGGGDEKLITLGPGISAGSASSITGTSARIGGTVNPNGEATTFAVEYVSEADFEESEYANAVSVPVPPQELGAAAEPVEVHQQLGGLTPATTYHFRLTASNGAASSQGSDRLFTTLGATTGALPNGRAYEMVSPPQKLGEVFPPEPSAFLGGRFSPNCPGECLPGVTNSTTPMQSSPDGEAIVYEGQPLFADLAAAPNEYLARRSASGWSSESLSPLPYRASGLALGHSGYQAFSADLAEGVLSQGEPALSASAPSQGGEAFSNVYLTNAVGSLEPNESGFLAPLVSEAPENRSPGEFFTVNSFFVAFGGANSGTASVRAFSHVLFEANDALTAEVPGIAPGAVDGGAGETNLNLYEWAGGELRLVNVAPGNATTAPGAVIGSGRLLAGPFPELEAPAAENAISDNGSRIFWSEEATGQVFVRIEGEETQEIKDPGAFLGASADGSKVMLDDGCLYDIEADTCEDLGGGVGEFQGILGASEDLSHIYFVDKAVLTGGEKNANGEAAQAGAFNLYLWEDGATTFIGRLQGEDDEVSAKFGAWRASPLDRTAQVSPDGRYLAFMSRAALTGYDNNVRSNGCRGIAGNPFCYEVFEYNAASGTLSCVSCNPSGQRPLGQANLSLLRPGPLTRQPANLSPEGEGRIFFESQDELVARDTNEAIQDVYEWEPGGVGSCKRVGGCVSLISSGHASGDSFFVDSSSSGDDAFFITRQQLLPQDRDDRLDIYDARVGGGFPSGGVGTCNAEACKGPDSSSPAVQGPATGGVGLPGNPPRPCKPGFFRKHGSCVKKHHRKHKRHHKRSAKHSRGGAK